MFPDSSAALFAEIAFGSGQLQFCSVSRIGKVRPLIQTSAMDPNLLSAFIGLGGGLLGVAIGAYLQMRVTRSQMGRETTLHLYDRLDDPDIMDARIKADRILATNASSPQPQSLSQLYVSLPREDWQHISRTRHFLDQIGLLHRIGYLDDTIAVPLFSSFVDYWVDRYFAPLEALERSAATASETRVPQWRVTSQELKKLFPKN